MDHSWHRANFDSSSSLFIQTKEVVMKAAAEKLEIVLFFAYPLSILVITIILVV